MAMGPIIVEHRENKDRCDPSPMHSPSDGSTTVSATSSPGIDEQEHEQMSSSLRLSSDMQFKPVGDLFSLERERERERDAENNATLPSERHIQHQTSSSSNDNGEVSPRKKPRKQQMLVFGVISWEFLQITLFFFVFLVEMTIMILTIILITKRYCFQIQLKMESQTVHL